MRRQFARFMTAGLVTVLAVVCCAGSVFAQRGGGDWRRGGDRNEESEGEERRQIDPREVVPRFDQNGDGIIQPDEVTGRTRRFYERLVREAGLSPDQPIRVRELIHRLEQQQRAEQRQQLYENYRSGFASASPDGVPPVPAFGVEEELPPVPGFGVPEEFSTPLEELYSADVLRRVDEIFARYDTNRDGLLDAEEQQAVRWRSDPRESDLNGDGFLDRREMAERLSRQAGESGRGGGSSGGDSGTAGSGGSGDGDDRQAARIRSYAQSLMRQYDANGNGVLDRDEWSRMSGNIAAADLNNDGVITLDELVNHLSNYSRGRDGGGERTGDAGQADRGRTDAGGERRGGFFTRGRGSSPERSTDSAETSRNSYRFLTPTERLPRGLPSWFARSDTNGDGQVSMSEFAGEWTPEKAAEFRQLDLDGDGFISIEEALFAERNRTAGGTGGSTGSRDSRGGR